MTLIPRMLLLGSLAVGAPAWAQDAPAPSPAPTDEAELVESEADDVEALREEIEVLRQELEQIRTSVEAPAPPAPPATPEPPEAPAPPAPIERPADLPDRTSFGEPILIAADEHVGDVASFGGPITVQGHVWGDVTSFGGPIELRNGAMVEGDAVSFGGVVHVADGARLKGDRVNMAGSRAFNLKGAQEQQSKGFLAGLFSKLIFLLSFAGAGVLVVGLFPERVTRVASDIAAHPVRNTVLGALFAGVISIATVLFAITILGLPVSLLMVALLGLAWLLGFVGLCQAVGDRLPFDKKPHGRWIAFLVGVLVVSFVGALPFVGWLAVLIVSVLGIGAAFATKFGATAP